MAENVTTGIFGIGSQKLLVFSTNLSVVNFSSISFPIWGILHIDISIALEATCPVVMFIRDVDASSSKSNGF